MNQTSSSRTRPTIRNPSPSTETLPRTRLQIKNRTPAASAPYATKRVHSDHATVGQFIAGHLLRATKTCCAGPTRGLTGIFTLPPFDFFSAMYFLIARRLLFLLRFRQFFRASCFMLILLERRDKPASKEGTTICCDWSGKMASADRMKDDVSNVVIIDKAGIIRSFTSGEVMPEQIDDAKKLLKALAGE